MGKTNIEWRVPRTNGAFYVYRLLDINDEVVYVGMSVNPSDRLKEHLKPRANKPDAVKMIVVKVFLYSNDCSTAENDEIRKFNPKYNVVGTERGYSRQAQGIALAKARGVYTGRALSLTGEQVRGAREAIANGVSKTQVAKNLGVARQTLYTALARETP